MKNDVSWIFYSIGKLGGGIKGHNPPEDGVLQHFQQVFSLNIDDTEIDAVGP